MIAAAVPARADEVIERVLATVGGDLITQSDVVAARAFGIVAGTGSDRDVLSRLIDRSLMLAEVDRYAPPEPSAEAVDRDLEMLRAKFESVQGLANSLGRVGMDEKYLRDLLRQNLRIRAYLDQRFTIPSPTEDEERTYYRDHAADFTVNGIVGQFELAREAIVRSLQAARRDALINDWVASLRRRATITEPQLEPR